VAKAFRRNQCQKRVLIIEQKLFKIIYDLSGFFDKNLQIAICRVSFVRQSVSLLNAPHPPISAKSLLLAAHWYLS
jgi:hypothetical protein